MQEKQGLATGSHGWLAAASHRREHSCQACKKLKRHANWSTTRQNRTIGHSVTSRLELATQSSHEPALFWKTWLFTFHSHPSINTPLTHEIKRASKENFERETPEKKRLTHPQSLPKRLFKFLYSLPLHCQILERLVTKTLSHHFHFCERAFWCLGSS